MTLTEKILVNHLIDPAGQELVRGESYADFHPDRVAMQDATAQMALLQFMTAGLPEVAVPSTVHCDHLIQAKVGASIDLGVAIDTNQEVYDFLRSVSAKYGIGFWGPGSGIIHQVVLENYAFPGGMMIGTDSPHAQRRRPRHGRHRGGGRRRRRRHDGLPVQRPVAEGDRRPPDGLAVGLVGPKDVILEVARVLTVEGGTGAIIEYHGPGADSISATGKGTICNMGAEIGATTSLFPYDANMAAYLKATGREAIADAADKVADELRPDDGALLRPAHRDRPRRAQAADQRPALPRPRPPRRQRGRRGGRGERVAAGDLLGAHRFVHQLVVRGHHPGRVDRPPGLGQGADVKGRAADHAGLRADPGDDRARRPARRPRGRRRDRAGQRLRAVHRPVVAAGEHHGAAQHDRQLVQPQLPEAQRRLGQHAELRHVAGHGDGAGAVRAARLRPDHRHADRARRQRGPLDAPVGEVLPDRGYDPGEDTFTAPPEDGSGVDVVVSPTSDRLQLLDPFPAWDGEDYDGLPVLVKAKGKFTTDHISMAGPWLKYRGHLENISGNLYLGAVSAYEGYEPAWARTS